MTDVSKNSFPTEFVEAIDFFLIVHQLRGDIEHLFQREIFKILDNTLNI